MVTARPFFAGSPQSGSCAGAWNWKIAPKNNGAFITEFHTFGTAIPNSGWWRQNQTSISLNKGATYRFEWAFKHESANPDLYTLHLRIYDASGTLLYDDTNIYNSDASVKLADAANLITFTQGSSTPSCLRHLLVDSNGWNTQANNGPAPFLRDEYTYWGGVCVRSDTWCGPYAGGT